VSTVGPGWLRWLGCSGLEQARESGILGVLDVWLLLMIVCVGCGLWLCVGLSVGYRWLGWIGLERVRQSGILVCLHVACCLNNKGCQGNQCEVCGGSIRASGYEGSSRAVKEVKKSGICYMCLSVCLLWCY